VSKVSAQNTPQINYYAMPKMPLFGWKQKYAIFIWVYLNKK